MPEVPDDDSPVYLITPSVATAQTWAINHHVDIKRVRIISKVAQLRGIPRGQIYRMFWPPEISQKDRNEITGALPTVSGTLVRCT